jgi:hypothetical protein
LPSEGLTFGLYGKSGAFSEKHVDPEGAATCIHILSGKKIWATMVGNDVVTLKRAKNWTSFQKWDVALLEEGDVM